MCWVLWSDICCFQVKQMFLFWNNNTKYKKKLYKEDQNLSKYILYAHIYFILYHCVDVEMCAIPLWNLFESNVRFMEKIAYTCMFWMSSILTH